MVKKNVEEIEETERYKYLLVEYVKQISNELTYLLMIVTTLFLYILTNLFSDRFAGGEAIVAGTITSLDLLRIVLITILIIGFLFFTLSTYTKRNIEKKFEKIKQK